MIHKQNGCTLFPSRKSVNGGPARKYSTERGIFCGVMKSLRKAVYKTQFVDGPRSVFSK